MQALMASPAVQAQVLAPQLQVAQQEQEYWLVAYVPCHPLALCLLQDLLEQVLLLGQLRRLCAPRRLLNAPVDQ